MRSPPPVTIKKPNRSRYATFLFGSVDNFCNIRVPRACLGVQKCVIMITISHTRIQIICCQNFSIIIFKPKKYTANLKQSFFSREMQGIFKTFEGKAEIYHWPMCSTKWVVGSPFICFPSVLLVPNDFSRKTEIKENSVKKIRIISHKKNRVEFWRIFERNNFFRKMLRNFS